MVLSYSCCYVPGVRMWSAGDNSARVEFALAGCTYTTASRASGKGLTAKPTAHMTLATSEGRRAASVHRRLAPSMSSRHDRGARSHVLPGPVAKLHSVTCCESTWSVARLVVFRRSNQVCVPAHLARLQFTTPLAVRLNPKAASVPREY